MLVAATLQQTLRWWAVDADKYIVKLRHWAALTLLQRPHRLLELTAQLLLRPGVLMQKEKNPENATKLLSNLVGVAGAHIDALDSQGMHDKLYFNWTAFTQPEFVTKILDYSQARQPAP